ncbi:MAG TPA: aminomethyl-transferring glycine dehydrogenase subunit GcvPA [Nitrososphaerales archaeon]|nr:aminomethyl-transferring glycine dehydrogenase subunit GcvPA [Nitrososphaerales archaeon]
MVEAHPFLPNLEDETIQKMLRQVKAGSIADLFSDIPEQLRLGRKLAIPKGEGEAVVRKEMTARLAKNKTPPESLCFLGGGVYPHYIPAAVDSILSRQEFYTAYTPYQPEISQGMLQALFEYQSMMCDLTGMQVCNSSMYDWASAAGEAVRMAVRAKKRATILVSKSVGRGRLEVIETYAEPMGAKIQPVEFHTETGGIDLDSLRTKISRADGDVAALYLENPNVFGVIEEGIDAAVEMVHAAGGLAVVGVNPISLSVLREPGSYGADVAVGEGQPLGVPMNFGGPHMGIFAVKDVGLARSMPGRLIGMTTTKDGREKAFCMVLQTREQHIRREAATSNICTNQALLALAAAAYMSLLGKNGFRKLGEVNLANSHYAAEKIGELHGVKAPLFSGPFFGEFTVGYQRRKASWVFAELAKRGVMGGYPLAEHFEQIGEAGAFCVTEVHSSDEIRRLVDALGEVV